MKVLETNSSVTFPMFDFSVEDEEGERSLERTLQAPRIKQKSRNPRNTTTERILGTTTSETKLRISYILITIDRCYV